MRPASSASTVGYGDYFPVTQLGRIVGIFVMFSGVGIIGALASILASVLVAGPTPDEPESTTADADATTQPSMAAAGTATAPTVEAELAGLRAEVAALRQALAVDPPTASG